MVQLHYILIISIILALFPLLPLVSSNRRKDVMPHLILSLLMFLSPYVIQVYFLEYKGKRQNAEKIIFETRLPFKNAFYAGHAEEGLRKLKEKYEELLTGIIPFKDLDKVLSIYIDFIDHAKAEGNILKATSTVDPKRVWTKQARDANRRFIERGGKIERIFLCASKDYRDVREEIDKQRQIGVKVSVCCLENLSPDLHRDFIVNEQGNVAMQSNVSNKGVAWSGILIENPEKVEELKDMFETIKKNCQSP